jgi:hypothetical protein
VSLTWNWDECYEVDGADKPALLDYLLTGRGRRLDETAVEQKIAAFRRSLGV